MRTCIQCGTDISERPGMARLCKSCARSRYLAQQRAKPPRRPDTPCSDCGTMLYRGRGSLEQPTCRPCRKARTQRERTCEICGQPRPQHTDRFCSLTCASKARQTYRACALCGEMFARTNQRRTYCGRECSEIAKTRIWKWRCLVQIGGCLECGAIFCADARQKRRFCSARCRSRYSGREWYRLHPEHRGVSAHRRRARMAEQFVEDVDPVRVYERDKWTCHICGGKVRRSPRRKHDPDMASLDHILPIALGGEHSYANVACAHYRCNLSKGKRSVGEQLALIG